MASPGGPPSDKMSGMLSLVARRGLHATSPLWLELPCRGLLPIGFPIAAAEAHALDVLQALQLARGPPAEALQLRVRLGALRAYELQGAAEAEGPQLAPLHVGVQRAYVHLSERPAKCFEA
eukprot:CAMPEP_0179088248 /NCGR_PEP_ID=MMETSP0796-20121207/40142_1 /TAXON_ID=73915 /ORGANISM="Pyrodinium bahamense, Strain pbaha01" /LENGTH=120 /DNA_ID=CAMNT_0020785773 /DNA_START=300 /DNA_END=663 /DNA_ORIENTATION=-